MALVGGGGKTTLLFALGGQLPARTLLTTTTRMGRDRTGGFPCLIDPSDAELAAAFSHDDAVLVWKSADNRKALGFGVSTVDGWFSAGTADHIVVEADGARRRPFTAPAPWEPPIPPESTHVVACIGADALGYVIADRLHRPLRVAAAARCSPYERLTPQRAANALTSPVGMMKNVPPGARFTVAINGADPDDPQVAELVDELERRETASMVVTRTGTGACPVTGTAASEAVLSGRPARRGSDRDADAIVVGGGHNGLVCAAYLARAGADTMLLEARDEVGGCASTVSDLGARFNICSCDHTLVRAMPFMDDLDLEAHGLRYLESDPATVYMGFDDAAPWLFFNDSERTIESIARHRPSQAEAYRRYLADARPVAELTLEMGTGAATTPRLLARLLARRARGGARLLQWSRLSALDVLTRYFDDETLITAAISNGPSVWGAPPDGTGTGLAGSLFAMRHMVKTGRPVGGSGALTDALAASFTAAGGRLRCGTAVAGLLGDGSEVRGVRLSDGTEISAAAVVVACDPDLVATEWLPAPRRRSARRFVDRARSQPPGDGYQSKIDAVITDVPQYAALEKSALLDLFEGRDPNESNFVISPSVSEILEAHRLRSVGRVAQHPTFMGNVPSVLDPSMRSTDGHHVLSLEALFTPYALEGGWDGSTEPARWLQVWSSLLQPGLPRLRRPLPGHDARPLRAGVLLEPRLHTVVCGPAAGDVDGGGGAS